MCCTASETGIPRKTGLETVHQLGLAEDAWDKGTTAQRSFVAVRFVDDVVMASADFCRSSLTIVLQTVYPRGVQFDVAKPHVEDSDDQVKIEWLDLTISLLKDRQA